MNIKNIVFNEKIILESLKKDGEYYFVKNNKNYLLYKWEQCDGCLLFLTKADNSDCDILWQSALSTLKENVSEFIENFSA